MSVPERTRSRINQLGSHGYLSARFNMFVQRYPPMSRIDERHHRHQPAVFGNLGVGLNPLSIGARRDIAHIKKARRIGRALEIRGDLGDAQNS